MTEARRRPVELLSPIQEPLLEFDSEEVGVTIQIPPVTAASEAKLFWRDPLRLMRLLEVLNAPRIVIYRNSRTVCCETVSEVVLIEEVTEVAMLLHDICQVLFRPCPHLRHNQASGAGFNGIPSTGEYVVTDVSNASRVVVADEYQTIYPRRLGTESCQWPAYEGGLGAGEVDIAVGKRTNRDISITLVEDA